MGVDTGQNFAVELLQKLQVYGECVARAFGILVRVQGRDDVEGIDTSVRSGTDVDQLTSQVFRDDVVLVFGVENEYFTVFRRKVGQQRFGRVGFTRAGFTHNDHVGVDSFVVTHKKVDDHGKAFALSDGHAAFFHNGGQHEREHRGDGITVDRALELGHGLHDGRVHGDHRAVLIAEVVGQLEPLLGKNAQNALFEVLFLFFDMIDMPVEYFVVSKIL